MPKNENNEMDAEVEKLIAAANAEIKKAQQNLNETFENYNPDIANNTGDKENKPQAAVHKLIHKINKHIAILNREIFTSKYIDNKSFSFFQPSSLFPCLKLITISIKQRKIEALQNLQIILNYYVAKLLNARETKKQAAQLKSFWVTYGIKSRTSSIFNTVKETLDEIGKENNKGCSIPKKLL